MLRHRIISSITFLVSSCVLIYTYRWKECRLRIIVIILSSITVSGGINTVQTKTCHPPDDDIRSFPLVLFYDYQNNLKQYAIWQEYFRKHQPPTLVVWGKNDIFFGPQGALAFQRNIKDVEVHLLNTGHFPLEEDLDVSVYLDT